MTKKQKEEFTRENAADLEKLQQICYEKLHKPMVIKCIGFNEAIWYVCSDCLDRYVKDHPEIKHLLIGFKR